MCKIEVVEKPVTGKIILEEKHPKKLNSLIDEYRIIFLK